MQRTFVAEVKAGSNAPAYGPIPVTSQHGKDVIKTSVL
jgi:hypothetical protein